MSKRNRGRKEEEGKKGKEGSEGRKDRWGQGRKQADKQAYKLERRNCFNYFYLQEGIIMYTENFKKLTNKP